jgi:hypothetical protein
LDAFRSSDCSTAPDEITATGRILVIGPPRSGTTWVEQVLGRATSARVVHEPDNETCNPFALRAKTPLGRFPVLAPGDIAPPAYVDLWGRAFGARAIAAPPAGSRPGPSCGRLRPTSTPPSTSARVGSPRDLAAGFKSLCAALGVPWTEEAAGFLAASDRPGKGLETRRVAAEQPSNWCRHLTVAQVDEVVEVLSAFPDRLFGGASVP